MAPQLRHEHVDLPSQRMGEGVDPRRAGRVNEPVHHHHRGERVDRPLQPGTPETEPVPGDERDRLLGPVPRAEGVLAGVADYRAAVAS